MKTCHYSSLNPLAPEYHPSFTTTLHHCQPHPSPLTLLLHQNLYNFLTYYYLITPVSLNRNNTPTFPFSPPAVTTNRTPDDQTPLVPTTRTVGQWRSGGRRRVRRRAPATVTTVEGNGVERNNGDRDIRRVSGNRRRVCGNNSGREYSKGDVMELERDAACTTVMIRNIPARYTSELLIKFLDKHCKDMNTDAFNAEFTSAYDFVYLPVDFGTKANKGFAFVNFTDPRAAWRFYETSNNQSWDLFRSSKIRQIVRAKLQGKENLVKHFRGSTFRCKSDDYLPVYFSPPRDGSAGQKVKLTRVGYRVW